MAKSDSICWDCANACRKCSWSENFEPVPGWDATPTKIKQDNNRYEDSFIVHNCPLFVTDTQNSLVPITSEEISKFLNVSQRDVVRIKKENLIRRCETAGLKLVVTRKNGKRQFFYKREITPARYIPSEVAKLFRVDVKDTAF